MCHSTLQCQVKAYFLPVELSAAAESIVEELQQLKLLDRAKADVGKLGIQKSDAGYPS